MNDIKLGTAGQPQPYILYSEESASSLNF